MYSILLKSGTDDYKIYNQVGSLANAECGVEDLVLTLVGLLEGYGHGSDFIVKEHPTSTQGTPEYYAILENHTYKIYHHVKKAYWLSSEHVYEKIYSVKLVCSNYERTVEQNTISVDKTVKEMFKPILIHFNPDFEINSKVEIVDLTSPVKPKALYPTKQLTVVKKIDKETVKKINKNLNRFSPTN